MAKKIQSRTVTPVQLSKTWKIRPQMIFNWIKQGAPHEIIGGKKYVDPMKLQEWRDEREADKKERQKEAVNKRSQQDKIGHDSSEALRTFKPQRIKHYCDNCGGEQDFLCDVMFVGEEIDNYITAYCINCHTNHRMSQGGISNEIMRSYILEGKPLEVPCGSWVRSCRICNPDYEEKTPDEPLGNEKDEVA